MNKALKLVKENKKATVTALATGLAIGAATAAGAEADTGTVTAVTTQMTAVKDTGIAVLASVAGVAILLFGGIYSWRYGKKVFSIIAK